MSEKLKPPQLDVVFRNCKGQLSRVTVDSKTNLETLIHEREQLGDTVELITASQYAKEMLENQSRDGWNNDKNFESPWRR